MAHYKRMMSLIFDLCRSVSQLLSDKYKYATLIKYDRYLSKVLAKKLFLYLKNKEHHNIVCNHYLQYVIALYIRNVMREFLEHVQGQQKIPEKPR